MLKKKLGFGTFNQKGFTAKFLREILVLKTVNTLLDWV